MPVYPPLVPAQRVAFRAPRTQNDPRRGEGGKVFQRVHVVCEPLTDYLRYELGWSYPPNVEAGEEARCCPEVRYHRWYGLG